MLRSLGALLRRVEAYASFIFSGMRLGLWLLGAGIAAMILCTDRRAPWLVVIPVLSAFLILAAADFLLIRFVRNALETGADDIIIDVDRNMRLVPKAGRLILGIAYFVIVASSVVYCVLIEHNWIVTFHISSLRAVLYGLIVTFALSFTSNLALVGCLAAFGFSARITGAIFKNRLLVDAVMALLSATLMIAMFKSSGL